MKLTIKNIGTLAGIDESGRARVTGADMKRLETIGNAYLTAEDGLITAYGPMEELPEGRADEEIDARGGVVLPAFCDSHTHIVYAGSREGEFVDKINGLSYEEIARRGGGILNSADRLHTASEQELYEEAMPRLRQMMESGTGAAEIKSGYGLSTEDELKMLRVIRRMAEESPMTIRATFLGAHAVARDYIGRQAEYVDLICREMIPAVAAEGLADFVDVFCDRGFFTPEETARMLECGAKYGMRPKIHANELAASGGIQVGVAHGALSVDHLEFTGEEEIAALLDSQTMPTILPGAAFFLGMNYPPARRMIDAGLQSGLVALGQHEVHRVARLHQAAHEPAGGFPCSHPERRLRHGTPGNARQHHQRQKGQPLDHGAGIVARIHPLRLRHLPHCRTCAGRQKGTVARAACQLHFRGTFRSP